MQIKFNRFNKARFTRSLLITMIAITTMFTTTAVWAIDTTEDNSSEINANSLIEKQTNDGSGIVPRSHASIPVDDINSFAKAYAITKNYYVENVSDNKLMNGAINGMLTNLDPHSSYLDKEAFKQLNDMVTYGSFAGLGIEVSREKDSGIKVVAPIEGTPAYYAGIRSGDIIMKINNLPVSNMTLEEAIKKMRGKAGTKVHLTISRNRELKPLHFSITRNIIKIKSVKYAMLKPDYAYLRITNFQVDTVANMVNTLNKIISTNHSLKGIVLDLRDNPGGILQAAVGVAGGFLPENNLIVYTKGRSPNANQKFRNVAQDYLLEADNKDDLAHLNKVFKKIPLIVLINQGTASASEIVAGALQDYARAKIVGTKSFGKGSVQTVIPLSTDTAIKLTTALYYTPKGRSIQAEGIKPDIIIHSEYDDLLNSWDMSEAGLNKHLSNPNQKNSKSVVTIEDTHDTPIINPSKQITTQAELKSRSLMQIKSMPKIVHQDQANVSLKDDFQLQWALNILEGKPIPKPTRNQQVKQHKIKKVKHKKY